MYSEKFRLKDIVRSDKRNEEFYKSIRGKVCYLAYLKTGERGWFLCDEMQGFDPVHRIHTSIVRDVFRDEDGDVVVCTDNTIYVFELVGKFIRDHGIKPFKSRVESRKLKKEAIKVLSKGENWYEDCSGFIVTCVNKETGFPLTRFCYDDYECEKFIDYATLIIGKDIFWSRTPISSIRECNFTGTE